MKFLSVYLIILAWFLGQSHGHIFGSANGLVIKTSHALSSAFTIVKGLGKTIKKIIPKRVDLPLLVPKVIGFSEKAIARVIKKLCSWYFAADTIKPKITPNMDTMALRLVTPCKQLSIPLVDTEKILQRQEFDIQKKVVIFVTGWMASPDAAYVDHMARAFNCRGGYNFLVLNSSGAIDTLYTWSAYNTEEIGRQLALGLQKLVNQIPVENIHLIGHSLGAHIVGSTGRHFSNYTGLNLTRITGLDPANLCFNEGETLSGLQRGDAHFIDVVHSNPGVLGTAKPIGDVDFYAGGLAPIKPKCRKFGCSHSRSIYYFIESVYPGNENNFLGTRCTSLFYLNKGICDGSKFPMGFAVPYNLKGNYFLPVNGKAPYGKNSTNQQSVSSDCGTCQSQ